MSVSTTEIFQIQRRGRDSLTTQGRHWCGVLPIFADSCAVHAPNSWRDIARWCGDCKEQAPFASALRHSALVTRHKLQLPHVLPLTTLVSSRQVFLIVTSHLLEVVHHLSKCDHKILFQVI